MKTTNEIKYCKHYENAKWFSVSDVEQLQKELIKCRGNLMKEIIELEMPDENTASIQTIKINVLQLLSDRQDEVFNNFMGK